MKPNFLVTVRERGKLRGRRILHNVWTDPGREYLRRISSDDATTTRPKYLQLGIGGKTQTMAIPVGVSAAYPAGADPNATDGHSYDHEFHIRPNITTLERPIRRTGGSTPYPGAPGDNWLTPAQLPDFRVTNPTFREAAIRYIVNISGGHYLYAPFTEIPLSEMGIALSNASTSTPFNPVVAYVNFDPIPIVAGLELEVYWSMGF